MATQTEKQIVHDWSSGELVEYEIEVEALPKAEPADDAPAPLSMPAVEPDTPVTTEEMPATNE